jgi:PAS domain-containing protein
MGLVEGSRHPDDMVSHGICEECVDNFRFQQGVPLQQYLDSLPVPIFAVDNDVVVQAVNKRAREVFGKDRSAIEQKRGGNVFECAHARLPEGCGRTVHCSGCAIRRTVMKTYETGEPQSMVPATLHRQTAGRHEVVTMTITTVKVDDVVMLRVDHVCSPMKLAT